eukprot:8011555-Heterocapsa_arctica.AAC.1
MMVLPAASHTLRCVHSRKISWTITTPHRKIPPRAPVAKAGSRRNALIGSLKQEQSLPAIIAQMLYSGDVSTNELAARVKKN